VSGMSRKGAIDRVEGRGGVVAGVRRGCFVLSLGRSLREMLWVLSRGKGLDAKGTRGEIFI